MSHQRWLVRLTVVVLAVGGDALAIQRCVGEHGEVMFTQSCPGAAAQLRQRPSNQGRTVTAPVPVSGTCARTPQQLEEQVRSALATRNGIRLSGLALWHGVPARAARGEARELLQLLKAGSASVALETASAYPAHDAYYADAPTSRALGPALIVMPLTQRRDFTHTEQLRFNLVRDHGCYWLSPRPHRVLDETMQTRQLRSSDDIEPVALQGR